MKFADMSTAVIASVIREAANILEKQPIHVQNVANKEDPETKAKCFCAGSAIGRAIFDRGLVDLSGAGDMYDLGRMNSGWGSFGIYLYSPVCPVFGKVDDYNDSHSKDETVAHMRARADELDPHALTIEDVVCTGPNLTASKTADESSKTPADFRRRLLAWAEVLESDLVANHWGYGTFGSYSMKNEGLPTCEVDKLSCGTVACAAGWMHVIPEAWRGGIMAAFTTKNNSEGIPTGSIFKGYSWDNGRDTDDMVSEWLGIERSELESIMFAHGDSLRRKGAPVTLDMNYSSPKDVAKVIRWFADSKYPIESVDAPIPYTPTEPEPVTVRNPKVDKPGSKRFLAKFLRGGAKFLETHKHGAIALYSPTNDTYCGLGACAAASLGKEKLGDGSYDTELTRVFNANGKDWFSVEGQGKFGDIPGRAYVALFGDPTHGVPSSNFTSWNDSAVAKRADNQPSAIRWLRTMAWMLDHAGRLPPWLGGPTDSKVRGAYKGKK